MSRRSRSGRSYSYSGESFFDSNRRLPRVFEDDLLSQFDRRAEPWPTSGRDLADYHMPFSSGMRLFQSGFPAVARQGKRDYSAMRILRIAVPSKVKFCIVRKVRREVLFARDVAGRRGLSGPYRRNQNSQYSC